MACSLNKPNPVRLKADIKKPEPLGLDGDIKQKFLIFKQDFELYCIASELNEKKEDLKIAILLNLIGHEALSVYNLLKGPKPRTVADILTALEQACAPKKNEVMCEYKFFKRNQNDGERFDDFLKDLEELMKDCDFGNKSNAILRTKIVLGINNKGLQERLLRLDPDLKTAIIYCQATEAAEEARKQIDPEDNSASVCVTSEESSQPTGKIVDCPNSNAEMLPLELLPIKVVETIAQFLTPEDLTACIATSRQWRELFNSEAIWKPFCDLSLEEHLKDTPCSVDPGFESPDKNNRTLPHISRWRLAFMREKHLCNNWRRGNHKKQFSVPESQLLCPQWGHGILNRLAFLTNDLVITLFEDKLELWDIKNVPMVLTDTFYYPFNFSRAIQVSVANNMIITVDGLFVQVFHFNPSTGNFMLVHMFYFEDSEKLSFNCSDQFKIEDLSKFEENIHKIEMFDVVGTMFVGASLRSTMHIWDLNTGVKIKEVICTSAEAYINGLKLTETNYVVLSILYTENCHSTADSNAVIVYSLASATFLPFHETFYSDTNEISFTACKKYVAVTDSRNTKVFNYLTSELLSVMLPQCPWDIISNNFIFVEDNEIVIFNTSSEKFQSLDISTVDFTVAYGKYLCLDIHNHLEMFQVDKNCNKKKLKFPLEFKRDSSTVFINNAATVYMVRDWQSGTISVYKVW